MNVMTKKYVFWVLVVLVYILGISIYYSLPVTQKISYKLERPNLKKITIEDFRIKETRDFLINTTGCYIPNYAKTFKYDSLVVASADQRNETCGIRAVFIRDMGNNTIKFVISNSRMTRYTRQKFNCCYKFASEYTIPGHEHQHLSYTKCHGFKNGSTVRLLQEVITVTCFSNMILIYQDAYIILKRDNITHTKSETKQENMQWNVLMIGLDSMSRTRVFDTMPQTTKYLKKYKWFNFKGYHKVGNNSFENLMSILTGKKMSNIYSHCKSDLLNCANYFIWEKYKDAGYKTALGESNLRPSETLSNRFRRSPTDHFMRPFYLLGERSFNKIICTGKKGSAAHLLQYAHQFVDSYKNNTSFGIFWINSYSYFDYIPQLLDTEIVNLFRKLKRTGVFNNTFVILFSDQGTTFGKMNFLMESLYDNKLPMMFIWTPLEFRRQDLLKHYNLHVNQERLITPYDLYITLADILKLSTNSKERIQSEACPKCTSLFEKKSPNNTCADGGINEYWCRCISNITKVDDDNKLDSTLWYAVAYIKKIRKSIKTIPCMSCQRLGFPTVIRAHEYNHAGKTYLVILFHMLPLSSKFEALFAFYGNRFKLISVRPMAHYNLRGNCVLRRHDRPYCVCSVLEECGPMRLRPLHDYLLGISDRRRPKQLRKKGT